MTLCAVTLDCADPLALAAFYEQATGWALETRSDEYFAGLHGPGGFFLGFQQVPAHRPPAWPDGPVPQQSHLDFEVDDLDLAEGALLRLGGSRAPKQPDRARYRVLLDPAGHPFCLTTSTSVRT